MKFSCTNEFCCFDEKQHHSIQDQVFTGRKITKSMKTWEQHALETIPDDAIITIKKFDASNQRNQTPYAGYNELEVCVPIWSKHMKQTLLYALTSGTAYVIVDGVIYIWYTPFKGMKGSGFFKLKRFVFINGGRTVKYFLNESEMLKSPL